MIIDGITLYGEYHTSTIFLELNSICGRKHL
jgi:hypothetical protein